METIIERGYGQIVLKDGKVWNYKGGHTDNGFCFKDTEAYESGNGICYISENGLLDLEDNLAALDKHYKENPLASEEDYLNDRAFILKTAGYTRKDILAITGGDIGVADDIFYNVDWQYPETYFAELFY